MFGSSRNRSPVSAWLRIGMTTATLAATAVLSSGCIAAAAVYVPV